MNQRYNRSRAHIRTALIGTMLFAGMLGPELRAQTNRAAASSLGHRCLFVFDTSKPMERRLGGETETVQTLLASGLQNQLRPGDTLGVWTYNEDLYTGRFPLQPWSAQGSKTIIASVTSFFRGQKYQKQPRFDKVLPILQHLATNSALLTVVVISSGLEEVHGTPFDDQINANYAQWRAQQEKNKMPFVTLLRVVQGKMTACAVAPAPWTLDVPPLPEPPPANLVQAKSVPPIQKPAPSTAQPLIFSGRKTGSATNNPAELAGANADVATNGAQAIVAAAAPVPPTPVPASTGVTSEQPKPTSALTYTPTVETKQPQPGTEPPPAGATSHQIPASADLSDHGKPAQTVARSEAPPKTDLSTQATPLRVAQPEQRTSAPPASSNSPLAGEALARPTPPAQISVAAPLSWLFSLQGVLLLAIVLPGTILWARWVRKKRAEARRPISLITRSLDSQHR